MTKTRRDPLPIKKAELNRKPEPTVSVTNLSKHKLTDSQISLLEKGLKFIPTDKTIDRIKLLSDLSEWERRMRLKEFFSDREDDTSDAEEDGVDKFKVKKKSYFTPAAGRDGSLDLYIELVKNDVVNSLKNKGSLNLTKGENDAFHELLHSSDIVIRPADKGSGIVVVDREAYVSSLTQEMKDSESYECTEVDMTRECHKRVKKLVNKMHKKGAISKDMKTYMTPKYVQSGKLKGNPKIHKPSAPYRTIVSGVGTPTEKMAEVAEHELNEFVESSPSYIRDTKDFINKLRSVQEPLPANSILFCFDVCKLYPSIPREEGLEACKEALLTRTNPLIDADHTLEIIETVLDNNCFGFGNKYYLQKEGVAIGSKLGRNFACAYMRKWDERLLQTDHPPFFYKRFIDDGFGIWTGTVQQLEAFADHANKIHRNIKVELRYDTKQLEFLDTLVKIDNGHVYTDLYVKPSDKQLYLKNSSCHPPSTKRGLAYGLGLRIRRICEKEADYRIHREDLKRQLRRRGYSGRLIESQLQKVDKLDRLTLLQTGKTAKRDTKAMQRVPLIVTYSNLLPNIHGIVNKHMHVLHKSGRMRDVFKEPPLVAYRRGRNLCDTLVHGKTNRAIASERVDCRDGCECCQIISGEALKDTTGLDSYKTVTNANCCDRNVIYAIRCTQCEKAIYVGETERTVGERMREHMRDVRTKADKPINVHFDDGYHIPDSLSFSILEKLYAAERTERQLREIAWIRKLNTARPHGCNVKDNWLPTRIY